MYVLDAQRDSTLYLLFQGRNQNWSLVKRCLVGHIVGLGMVVTECLVDEPELYPGYIFRADVEPPEKEIADVVTLIDETSSPHFCIEWTTYVTNLEATQGILI